ncbi:GIY-YIG nuclease family protein [Pseudomonas sp. 22-AL-CL-001]|uniref:GIY-YIG nuclease family protein n=1 Tax=Pseudomonas alabamensis TaxID=3064349 RepID=UPI002712B727|nr:GIY-YIG nuclease family protein [Pseudomonas sp. 22-AL-CL-001]MDO7908970.1 GIY-YIG nuclease family protein [Pseudomonas sp. 22-AL-CL-001]
MIYFFIEDTNESVKIGRAKVIEHRRKALQTGNPRRLHLLGWIHTEDGEDVSLEKSLHDEFSHQRGSGEWFYLEPTDVLPVLERHGINGFAGLSGKSFEVIGHDRDGIPEYHGAWTWGDLEHYECCPFCGSFCGMHYQEASSMYHCLNCDELTTFDFLRHQEDE